jgi:hypothetical protein
MKIFRSKTVKLTANQLNLPDLDHPGLTGYYLLLQPGDFQIFQRTPYQVNQAVTHIHHPCLQIGQHVKQVAKLFGKAKYIIDNQQQIKQHKVLVYKRFHKSYKTTTQVHLKRDLVFCIVEDMKFSTISTHEFSQLLHGFGIGQLPVITDESNGLVSDREGFNAKDSGFYGPGSLPLNPWLFHDPRKHGLLVDFSVHLHFQFQ